MCGYFLFTYSKRRRAIAKSSIVFVTRRKVKAWMPRRTLSKKKSLATKPSSKLATAMIPVRCTNFFILLPPNS